MSRSPRAELRKDGVAGLVLGLQSVPDGLATGLLAGANPLAGLYAYLFGMVGAATSTGTPLMVVAATGAMSLIIADADLGHTPDPDRALYTLAVMTGVIMVLAGLLRAGKLVRFVSTAVMTGFITAVGVNIVLGQLSTLTGYVGRGANRLVRSFDVLVHVRHWHPLTVAVGVLTIVAILVLRRTRVGSLGLVLAVVLGSLLAFICNTVRAGSVDVLDHIVAVPNGLPTPVLPDVGVIGYLLLPALSLSLVGLVQGAGVSAATPTPDGRPADASRDFLGQGVGNLVSGVFRGMPVGGSMGATALAMAAGARTRAAIFIAGAVMAVTILFAADTVGHVAMPALAGLLMVIGVTAIKPSRVLSVVRSSPAQAIIMAITFVLTVTIRLQFAVLIGVVLTFIVFVAHQANRVKVRQLNLAADGAVRESEPPPVVPPHTAVVLQVFGSLFFASAPTFERQLPAVGPQTRGSVVIVRLRGIDQIGLSHIEVLRRYANSLRTAGCTLKIVASEPQVLQQLDTLSEDIGRDNIYAGTEWIGTALRTAYNDALQEITDTR